MFFPLFDFVVSHQTINRGLTKLHEAINTRIVFQTTQIRSLHIEIIVSPVALRTFRQKTGVMSLLLSAVGTTSDCAAVFAASTVSWFLGFHRLLTWTWFLTGTWFVTRTGKISSGTGFHTRTLTGFAIIMTLERTLLWLSTCGLHEREN